MGVLIDAEERRFGMNQAGDAVQLRARRVPHQTEQTVADDDGVLQSRAQQRCVVDDAVGHAADFAGIRLRRR